MSNETRIDGAKADDTDPKAYLGKSFFLDFDSPVVRSFVTEHTQGANTDREKAIALFYAVRDKIRYNPYGIAFDPATYKASAVIEAAEGWCVSKGATMTACLRACGIPARPGYADVRNHLSSKRLSEKMGTDVFSYHGYVEVWLDGTVVGALQSPSPPWSSAFCSR